MTIQKYNSMGKREKIVSILYLISLISLIVISIIGLRSISNSSKDLVDSFQGSSGGGTIFILMESLGFLAGLSLLVVIGFLLLKAIVEGILLFFGNAKRNSRGSDYTLLSVLFIVFNFFYLLILFLILVSITEYVVLFVILFVQAVLIVWLSIIKIITIANKKKLIF